MIQALFFQNHTAAVARPARADLASTLHHAIKWDSVSGMSALPVHFQPRGQTPFQTDVGIVYDQSASVWVDIDVLPSGGEILTGDRLTIGSDTWDVVDSVLIEQGGINRMYRCALRRVNT